MKDIVDRLVADLRWRMSPAGREHRPASKERRGWGGLVIPVSVPWLLFLAYFTFSLVAAPQLFGGAPEWLAILLFGPPGMAASLYGAFVLRRSMERHGELKAYRRLLEASERTMLVEYHRYLRRQISRAQKDPAIGGPTEIARMNSVLSRLSQILASGQLPEGRRAGSMLGEEAEFAEAIVETYEEMSKSDMERLDSRLSGELRQRVSDLEEEIVALERGPRGRSLE